MRKFTLLNFLTIILLLLTTSLAYATRDIIEDMTSGPVCSGTDIILNDYDMNGDMVADLDVVIGISNGKVEIETDMVTGNKRIKITTGSGDCLNDFPGQITINFRNTADTDYRPVNFISLITDINSTGSTVTVEGNNSISPVPFSPTNFVILGSDMTRYQFISSDVIAIPITFTPPSDATDYVNYIDELIISDNTISGVVNVLDRSGSMNTDYNASTRIETARNALTDFNTVLVDFADKIDYGIVVYPEQPWSGICNAQEIAELQLLEDYDVGGATGPLDELTAIINALNASGNTPMLDAMNLAINQFTTQPFTSIVLLSDGYQNCPNPVNITDAEVTTLVDALNDKNITVNTIGFGSPSEPDLNLLAKLADETGGYFYDETHSSIDPVPNTVLDLSMAYNKTIKEGLGLEHSADPVQLIKKNESKTYDIVINPLDKKINFHISYETPIKDYLNISITSSDGKILPKIHKGIKKTIHSNSQIITIDKPFLELPGKVNEKPWKLTINASNIENDKEVFQYNVLCKSELRQQTWFNQKSFFTGDTLKIFSMITENNKTLAQLENVSLEVTSPEDGMGNWLVNNKISSDQANLSYDEETNGNASSQKKVNYPGEIKQSIPMNDAGIDGDLKAGDGIYTTMIAPLKKEGTYKFYIIMSGQLTGDKKGKFNRESGYHKYVNVKVEPEDFIANVTHVKDNQYDVSLSLKDQYGNVPYLSAFRKVHLSIDHGELVNGLESKPDGSIVQHIALPENIKPEDVLMTLEFQNEYGSQKLISKK